MSKDSTTTQRAADLPGITLPDFPGQAFEAGFKAYTEWLEQAGKIPAEAFQFFMGRINCDIDLFMGVCKCRKPYEMLTLQSDFAGKLVSDYLDAERKFVDLYSASLQAGLDKSLMAGQFLVRPDAGASTPAASPAAARRP